MIILEVIVVSSVLIEPIMSFNYAVRSGMETCNTRYFLLNYYLTLFCLIQFTLN